jgi:crossover junction endodeoxyribonuclease RuvC
MIVLGVDPGSQRTGYGVVETDGRHHQLVETGALAMSSRLSLPEKLRQIHAGVVDVITRLHPAALAVEDCFHAANTRTALVLGHVRGVVLLAGAEAGLIVREYPPATVKQQVSGYGRADKAQVAFMVTRLLELPLERDPGDATDALAVALCFACTHACETAVAVAAIAAPPGTATVALNAAAGAKR